MKLCCGWIATGRDQCCLWLLYKCFLSFPCFLCVSPFDFQSIGCACLHPPASSLASSSVASAATRYTFASLRCTLSESHLWSMNTTRPSDFHRWKKCKTWWILSHRGVSRFLSLSPSLSLCVTEAAEVNGILFALSVSLECKLMHSHWPVATATSPGHRETKGNRKSKTKAAAKSMTVREEEKRKRKRKAKKTWTQVTRPRKRGGRRKRIKVNDV